MRVRGEACGLWPEVGEGYVRAATGDGKRVILGECGDGQVGANYSMHPQSATAGWLHSRAQGTRVVTGCDGDPGWGLLSASSTSINAGRRPVLVRSRDRGGCRMTQIGSRSALDPPSRASISA